MRFVQTILKMFQKAGGLLFTSSGGQVRTDNSNLFWDFANKVLMLGRNTTAGTAPRLIISGNLVLITASGNGSAQFILAGATTRNDFIFYDNTPTQKCSFGYNGNTDTFEFFCSAAGFLFGNNSFATLYKLTNAGELVGITAGGGMGYGTGAGGTVTQLTSKATGVTLNKICGSITMNAAALAGDTTVSFLLSDTAILAGDVLLLNHISGGTPGSYLLNARSAAGAANIDVRNITTGSLSEAIVIQFAVHRAVTA